LRLNFGSAVDAWIKDALPLLDKGVKESSLVAGKQAMINYFDQGHDVYEYIGMETEDGQVFTSPYFLRSTAQLGIDRFLLRASSAGLPIPQNWDAKQSTPENENLDTDGRLTSYWSGGPDVRYVDYRNYLGNFRKFSSLYQCEGFGSNWAGSDIQQLGLNNLFPCTDYEQTFDNIGMVSLPGKLTEYKQEFLGSRNNTTRLKGVTELDSYCGLNHYFSDSYYSILRQAVNIAYDTVKEMES
jgi:hypothetical protein